LHLLKKTDPHRKIGYKPRHASEAEDGFTLRASSVVGSGVLARILTRVGYAAGAGVRATGCARTAWTGVRPTGCAHAAWTGVRPTGCARAAWTGVRPTGCARAAWTGVRPIGWGRAVGIDV